MKKIGQDYSPQIHSDVTYMLYDTQRKNALEDHRLQERIRTLETEHRQSVQFLRSEKHGLLQDLALHGTVTTSSDSRRGSGDADSALCEKMSLAPAAGVFRRGSLPLERNELLRMIDEHSVPSEKRQSYSYVGGNFAFGQTSQTFRRHSVCPDHGTFRRGLRGLSLAEASGDGGRSRADGEGQSVGRKPGGLDVNMMGSTLKTSVRKQSSGSMRRQYSLETSLGSPSPSTPDSKSRDGTHFLFPSLVSGSPATCYEDLIPRPLHRHNSDSNLAAITSHPVQPVRHLHMSFTSNRKLPRRPAPMAGHQRSETVVNKMALMHGVMQNSSVFKMADVDTKDPSVFNLRNLKEGL